MIFLTKDSIQEVQDWVCQGVRFLSISDACSKYFNECIDFENNREDIVKQLEEHSNYIDLCELKDEKKNCK